MKLTYLLISVMFSFLLFACGSTTENETQTSTSTTAPAPAPTPAPESIPTAASYETIVLKAGGASPKNEMKGMLGATKINIVYGSPYVKGRKIWGDLVPFGKVWRTGANEATTIEFSKDVQVEGDSLAAGKYGLFTIVNADQWTIIFNEIHDQWGANEYDESKDALRINVTPKKEMTSTEVMKFSLEGSNVVLKWEELAVMFGVK